MAITPRQKQFAINSLAGVLLLGVVLVLINVLSSWAYLRWDLTHNHAYSLSASSKHLARSLDEPIVVKAYFSPALPSPYNTYARYVRDVLIEYRRASHGKVRFEFVSPEPAQEFEKRSMEAGLTALQFEEMGSDQLQIRRGFMGLVMYYRDKSETIPVLKGVQNLEYDLTSRFAQMTRKKRKQIAILQGHNEIVWKGTPTKLAQDLPTFYDFDYPWTLPLASTNVPTGQDAVMVVGPQQPFDDASLWMIDQAIMQGHPVAFLIDSKRFLPSQFMVIAQHTGLEDLLKHYGVELTDRLVLDLQCETVSMVQNMSGMSITTSVRYPFAPQVTEINRTHPIMTGMESVGLPFVSQIKPATLPPGVTFTPLMSSSPRSWLAPAQTYNVAPNAIPGPKADEPRGPFVVSGLLEGTFPSYFADKPVPVKGGQTILKSPKTSLFILSTSHVMDPKLPEFSGTDALITNALAYLTHDETLIGIRSKGDIVRPLRPLPPAPRELLKFGCILVIPMLPVLWGLARWRRRSAWRKTIAAGFAAPATPT